jgi:predicted CXXCH cytochrome family protein
MKTGLFRTSGRRMAFAAAALAIAAIAPHAAAQISGTKHNLTAATGTGVNKFDGTQEICVFCHTPHGADTSAVVPLWNRKLAAPASYTTYDALGTSTLEGKTVPVGSVSIACLSCHDGTQAMNTVLNAPGSGNYNAAGFTMAGAWTGANVITSGADAGKLAAGIITNIGTDLRNDHPIGIQYAGGGFTAASPTSRAAGVGDADFTTPTHSTINTKDVWWVETGGAGRQKTDLTLYTRTEATAANTPEPFVECASCHDPHTAANPTFLRIANSGSAVCLACHTK